MCGCGGYIQFDNDDEIEEIEREIEEDESLDVTEEFDGWDDLDKEEAIEATEEFERVLVPVRREAEADR